MSKKKKKKNKIVPTRWRDKRGKISFFAERTIEWDRSSNSVLMIDQSLLPTRFSRIRCSSVEELVEAIKTMKIRGAPAIGVAGAMGVALAAVKSKANTRNELLSSIKKDCERIRYARPTAVNLSWGVDQALGFIRKELPEKLDAHSVPRLINFAEELAEEDVRNNIKLSDAGEKLLRDGDIVLTHCKWV